MDILDENVAWMLSEHVVGDVADPELEALDAILLRHQPRQDR